MSRLYRILRKPFAQNPFDGEGAYRFGGRWSSPGTRVSYASEHQSLAMLEYFVHLDKDDPPGDLVLATAVIPDTLPRHRITLGELPSHWREAAAPSELTVFGDEFVKQGQNCLLYVPSVLAPEESNCLINPAHADFHTIAIRKLEPLSYDARMFATKERVRR